MEIATEVESPAEKPTAFVQCTKLITPDQRCENMLDTEGSPKWCKKCRAKYQREYQALQPELAEKRGHARGVTALRTYLVGEFERLGSGTFNGYEIAELIRQAQI